MSVSDDRGISVAQPVSLLEYGQFAPLLESVIRDHPTLGSYGYGDRYKGSHELRDFIEAHKWITAHCTPSRRPHPATSYGLKHTAEQARTQERGAHTYVANGTFIAAAIACGYKAERIVGTPNARVFLRHDEPAPNRLSSRSQDRLAPIPVRIPPPTESDMRQYVKFYRDGDAVAISTNATTEPDFIRGTSEAFANLAESGDLLDDIEFKMAQYLPQIVDICCKLRGYKAPLVEESRVLTAGRIAPTESMLVAGAEAQPAPKLVGEAPPEPDAAQAA